MGRGCSKGGESLEAGGAGPLGPQGRQPPSLQDDRAHSSGLGTTQCESSQLGTGMTTTQIGPEGEAWQEVL